MASRFILKRDKKRTSLMVNHPKTGELVYWKDVSVPDKKILIRRYLYEALCDGYDDLITSLVNIEENKDEQEVAVLAYEIGRDMLPRLCNYEFIRDDVRGMTYNNGAQYILKGTSLEKAVFNRAKIDKTSELYGLKGSELV